MNTIEMNDNYEETENEENGENEETEKMKENTDKLNKNIKRVHYCYIIFDAFGSTYNGYTVNRERRIRQHNGEIRGGARFTTRKRERSGSSHHWDYLLSITSSDPTFDSRKALSLEWSIKNPTNRRTRPKRTIEGRIESLPLVFSNPKFNYLSFILYVHYNVFYEKICESLKNNANVIIVRM